MTSNGRPDPMPARLGWITSVDAESGAGFTLDDGTVCRLDRKSAWFDFWTRLVAKSQEYGWPVYVRSDAEGEVALLLHASVHTVEGIQPDPDDTSRFRVRLAGTDAIHFLKTDEPGGDALALRLQEAAASGVAVVIAQDALACEIVDVRFAPPVPSPA
jgi:hypothetical protein